VFLTVHPENPNGAKIRFLVDGAAPPDDLSGYDRVVLMFDGLDDQALSEARGHWKALKQGGHTLAYYKQNSGGGWERAA
jgi:DNA polymerase-3 subunit chi